MAKSKILGVMGGSGLYDIDALTEVREMKVETPFGAPSDSYVCGKLGETECVFLPRHGRGHRIAPHEINYRANIHGMKQLGVTQLLAISAVGSMREEIRPGDFVIVDQFIDRTWGRDSTFFEGGIVAHVGFADPVDSRLARLAAEGARATGVAVHEGGTYVCINGPQFSTRAESNLYRSWGVDVIGMTNATEAKLAREGELAFATVALATDYDCWRDEEDAVDVATVLGIVKKNVENAREVVAYVASRLQSDTHASPAHRALENAVMTAPELVPPSTRDRMRGLLRLME
ncbi:MAG: S-methyl-5'-thioadenosine phosphorylase [Polyangia bacterium]|jgi:5'-methylthioadenosine phosphorylase|nr:S-methyl-5'-thioadenosine phosphorylase [Polyangia bacterium]